MTVSYEADVVRLHNAGQGRAAIVNALHLTIGQVNGVLYRAGPKGILSNHRVSPNGVHLSEPGDGKAAVDKARSRQAKITPARDAAIKRLYGNERDPAVIIDAINALPGPAIDWREIQRRASDLQVPRFQSAPPPPRPAPMSSRPRRAAASISVPSARAALRGAVSTAIDAPRCCFPSWMQKGPPQRSAPRYCDAPVIGIQRGDTTKIMQYCLVHCDTAFSNFGNPAIWGEYCLAFPGVSRGTVTT